MTLIIRPARPEDAPALAALLNRIIAIGGTTAHETPFSADHFAQRYITNPATVCCHAAELDGALIGFQVLGGREKFPAGWAEIGSFVDPEVQRSGAGAALFAATLAVARAEGIRSIDASIRADNAPGLGYYSKRGFVDYKTDPDYRLKDGTRVGRISKRYDL